MAWICQWGCWGAVLSSNMADFFRVLTFPQYFLFLLENFKSYSEDALFNSLVRKRCLIMLLYKQILTYTMALKAYNITFHYIQKFTPNLACHSISPTSMGWFSPIKKANKQNIYIYYIDPSVLLENIPLVKFIKSTSGTRVAYFP